MGEHIVTLWVALMALGVVLFISGIVWACWK